MRDWLGPLAFHAALAVAFGLAAHFALGPAGAAIAVFAALVVPLARQFRARSRLRRWLANPSPESVPDEDGPWEDLYARLHRILRQERESREGLSNQLWRFRQAIEAMPDGLMLLDAESRIAWANPSAESHFGFAPGKDRGQPVTNLIRHPAFAGYLEARLYGEPLLLKGPREDDVILTVQLVPFGEREHLLLSRDVTRWERLEQVRRDFIANVSHELRTPLTVMSGFLETLADSGEPLPPRHGRALALMTDQADRMRRLVEDLLTLSRLEDSRYPLREEPVDVPALLTALAGEAAQLSGGRHRIETSFAPAWLTGGREELRSAFTNLVTNAVRYTPDGGEIAIEWALERGEPVMRVRDSGEGIAPEHIPRLTERFYRVDHSRSRASGGTGLGLAIVKHALARHQGRLEIGSVVGEGSTFTCRFPAARCAPSAAPREPASVPAA